MEIISREEARAAVKTHYFTGEVCRNGHLAGRFVSTTQCVDCTRERCAKYRRKPKYRTHNSDWQRKRYHTWSLEERRNYILKKHYGITIQDYDRMYELQEGKCGVCGKMQEGPFHVDHCHQTGKIRGLLCKHCNQGIGHFRDNSDILKAAIQYLERTQKWHTVN